MHNLTITIEKYDPTTRQVYKLRQSISDIAYEQDPEALEYCMRNLAKQFNAEWQIEKANLQYMPKKSVWETRDGI